MVAWALRLPGSAAAENGGHMRTRAGAVLVAAVFVAAAGPASTSYDPAQLPSVRGKVAEYSLSPRGEVDGLILADNTEIHFPPHLGAQLALAVKPGDAVTIHGLRARAVPMVQAMSITNDTTGTIVADTGPGGSHSQGGPAGPGAPGQVRTAEGKVRALLHGPRGELNGVLLDDGAIVRLPPPEAQRLAGQLTPGAPLFVQGPAVSGPLGRLILADRVGPNPDDATPVAAPPPRPMHRPDGPGAPPPPPRAG